MDFNSLKSLVRYIPKSTIKIAESGISTPQEAKELFEQGFDAILVGEALSKSPESSLLIKKMRGCYE